MSTSDKGRYGRHHDVAEARVGVIPDCCFHLAGSSADESRTYDLGGYPSDGCVEVTSIKGFGKNLAVAAEVGAKRMVGTEFAPLTCRGAHEHPVPHERGAE